MSFDSGESPDKPAERKSAEPGPIDQAKRGWHAVPDRWFRRVSFWRSVAGMAMAFAVACAAIALETAFELSSRSASFHRRLESLSARVVRLRTEKADAQRQFAAMRFEPQIAENICRVLTAADVVLLRLTDGAASARGLLALSSEEGSAIAVLSGLAATAGQTYLMWWLPAKGPPVKAARLKPDANGRVLIAVRLPRTGYRIAGALVTLESAKLKHAGEIVLKAALPNQRF